MAVLPIRIFGDPVLRQETSEISEVDDALVRLVEDMIETMYEAPGVGLAANQVGVQRRMFVYDVGEGPGVVLNPKIVESDGEWSYYEGCLSIPELAWDVVRPKRVHLLGMGMDGEDLDVEADELLARCFQHEVDHLDGVLLVQRLDSDRRKEAMRVLRNRSFDGSSLAAPAARSDI
ncbi:MAG: peptide deformylase [Acidimicrobiaceae bacterium]|nr:peptide deformylase [Acidimicrobiaceae bacterium]